MAELPSMEDSEIDFDDEELELEKGIPQKIGTVQDQSGASTSTNNSNMRLSAKSASTIILDESPSTDSQPGCPTTVECPTCFKRFPIDCIADHADLCIDDWVGEVDSFLEHVEQSVAPEGREHSQRVDVALKDLLLKLVQELVHS